LPSTLGSNNLYSKKTNPAKASVSTLVGNSRPLERSLAIWTRGCELPVGSSPKEADTFFASRWNQELENGTRIVSAGRHFVVLEPFASSSPFSTVIFPRPRQLAAFHELDEHERLN
jgi:hypothetical protein